MNSVQKYNEFVRAMVEVAPFAMIVVNPDGRILLANTRAENLFGYSREELVDQAFGILAEGFSEIASTLPKNSIKNPPEEGREETGRRKDGSHFPIEVRMNPIQIEGQTSILISMADL